MSRLVISTLFLATMAFASTNFKLDPAHTEVGFKVRHLMVTNVNGKFTEFEGHFAFDEKTRALEDLVAEIKVESINTAQEKRDKHLRSPDFFDAAKFEKMIFKQTKKTNVKKNSPVKLVGEITIRGVTKPLTLNVVYNGAVTDPQGNRVVGFEASGKLNRKDFGLNWNKNLDGGGLLVGDEVTITISGEAAAQAPAENKK